LSHASPARDEKSEKPDEPVVHVSSSSSSQTRVRRVTTPLDQRTNGADGLSGSAIDLA
jgi:hypothetical protein